MNTEQQTTLLKAATDRVALTRHYDKNTRKKSYTLSDGIFAYHVDFRQLDGGGVLKTVDADGQRWRSDVTTRHELERSRGAPPAR